ncbi:MAG: homocitrate synthase [Pseudomonadota bacterium]
MNTLPRGRAAVDVLLADAQAKLETLASLNPVLFDVSLREPCFSSYYGHTLQNKLDILPMVERFGIPFKVLATLDYQYPEHKQVEDDFCIHLRDTGYDMTGCFVFTAAGTIDEGVFKPTISMEKLVEYKIPNTLNEIYLMPPPKDPQLMLQGLGESIAWIRQNMPTDPSGTSRVYVNVVDLMDAVYGDPQWAVTVLEFMATLAIDGVSFEDGRGTYFPFQVAATVKMMKALLAPGQQVLFHCHCGNGMENASVIEALMAGCDGYWAGMDRESSTIGHASMSELVANLARAGNAQMGQQYQIDALVPITHAMHVINNEARTPQTWPIQGSNAYRQMLTSFDQIPERLMDLPPSIVGEQYHYRISPVGSDVLVVQGRVQEVMHIAISDDTAKAMILLMRDDLRAGERIRYNDPDQLRLLYQRAIE